MQEKSRLGGSADWAGLLLNREHPNERPAMLQTWHDLVFLHARVPVERLQALVPSSLTVEEFDGSGWLGFVPFSMSSIRPPWFPAVPWLSAFHETNLRTYVTHPEHGPGVWFFSLEAARYLACLFARVAFRLPYFHASMSGEAYRYDGRRRGFQLLPNLPFTMSELQSYAVEAKRTGEWREATPETFEYWLLERYRLYSGGEALTTAQVHHEPYVFANGALDKLEIAGLERQFGPLEFSSVLVAKTLNVQCFAPRRVRSS